MKKTTKKVYLYTVDLKDIKTLEDIDVVFALSKQDAKLPISDEELMDIVEYAVNHSFAVKLADAFNKSMSFIDKCLPIIQERKPWYKRILNAITSPVRKVWNWIKNKFKK